MTVRTFLFGSAATCAKGFVAGGKSYAKGQSFPYRELGMIEHDVRGLWIAEMIEFADPVKAANRAAQQSPPPGHKRVG